MSEYSGPGASPYTIIQQLGAYLATANSDIEAKQKRIDIDASTIAQLQSKHTAAQAEVAELRQQVEALELSRDLTLKELHRQRTLACAPAERRVLEAVALDVGVDGLDYDEWAEKVWLAREEMMLARRATREQPAGELTLPPVTDTCPRCEKVFHRPFTCSSCGVESVPAPVSGAKEGDE